MIHKSNLRGILKKTRADLTLNQVKQLSQQICNNVISSEVFIRNDFVGLYSALNNEVDLSYLLQSNKRFCLPVVHRENAMAFHLYDNDTILLKNKYGILEPQNNLIVDADEIDLCLMPLVGFNRDGSRLGMGGGYYDRYFEQNKSHEKPTILAGVAYDFQEDNTIQSQSWDVPLDIIFTNKEVIYCEVK